MLRRSLPFLLGFAATALAGGLPPLAPTPPLGFNSWTAFGTNPTAALIEEIGSFFVSSGLAAKGYVYVNLDDYFSLPLRSNTTGEIVPDPKKFPYGMANTSAFLHSLGLKFGVYSSASSVDCSGNPGSLFNEFLDAQTFASWGADYIKVGRWGAYEGLEEAGCEGSSIRCTGAPYIWIC